MNKKNLLCSLIMGATFMIGPLEAFAELKVGIFPRRPIAATYKAFSPLITKLTTELGEPVKLIVANNFKKFWKGVESGQYDLVHFNQYHYIKSHKEQGYRVILVNEEFGSSKIAGSLSVRIDSGIDSIQDLKGKTILFGGGKKAMGSYIAPTAILKKAGLEAGKDYKVKFSKNPPGAVIGVFNDEADAAGAGNVILKIKVVTKKIDVSRMKFLAESESFIHLPWAVKADMSKEKAAKIRDIMISLKNDAAGKAILKSAKVTGFKIVNDDNFAKVREITEYAIGETY